MSMSTHLVAFRDLDGKFKDMMEIKKFCDSKKVGYPKEVTDYFGTDINENDRYITEEYSKISIMHVVRPYNEDCSEGYEIHVADIPKDVKTIRFYNSW